MLQPAVVPEIAEVTLAPATLWPTDGALHVQPSAAAPAADADASSKPKRKRTKKPLNPALFSSASDRWYTPPDLKHEIDFFFDGETFDPCPASDPGQPIENGLWKSWAARRVFLNPPYGDAIAAWILKLRSDAVLEYIALVPSRTDTGWEQPLLAEADAICFIEGRLYFVSPEGVRDGAPFPSLLIYHGPRPEAFCQAFAHRGVTWITRRLSDDERAARGAHVEATLWQPPIPRRPGRKRGAKLTQP